MGLDGFAWYGKKCVPLQYSLMFTEICFPQLSTKIVWEEITGILIRYMLTYTPHMFSLLPTIVWSMKWPTYRGTVTWSKVRCQKLPSCWFFSRPSSGRTRACRAAPLQNEPWRKVQKKCCNRWSVFPSILTPNPKMIPDLNIKLNFKKRKNPKQSMRLLLHDLNASVLYASVAKGVVFYMYIEISDMSRVKPCVFEYINTRIHQSEPCWVSHAWVDIFIRAQLLLCNCFGSPGSPTWCCKEDEQQISTLAWVCWILALTVFHLVWKRGLIDNEKLRHWLWAVFLLSFHSALWYLAKNLLWRQAYSKYNIYNQHVKELSATILPLLFLLLVIIFIFILRFIVLILIYHTYFCSLSSWSSSSSSTLSSSWWSSSRHTSMQKKVPGTNLFFSSNVPFSSQLLDVTLGCNASR